jgi:hypothetical protein
MTRGTGDHTGNVMDVWKKIIHAHSGLKMYLKVCTKTVKHGPE